MVICTGRWSLSWPVVLWCLLLLLGWHDQALCPRSRTESTNSASSVVRFRVKKRVLLTTARWLWNYSSFTASLVIFLWLRCASSTHLMIDLIVRRSSGQRPLMRLTCMSRESLTFGIWIPSEQVNLGVCHDGWIMLNYVCWRSTPVCGVIRLRLVHIHHLLLLISFRRVDRALTLWIATSSDHFDRLMLYLLRSLLSGTFRWSGGSFIQKLRRD